MTPPASSLLLRLIDTAEAVTCRPRLTSDVDTTCALRDEVVAFVLKPIDGARLVSDEAVLLAQVLHLIARERVFGNARPAQLGCQLAGVMLPYIREDLTRAIVARRDSLAADEPVRR